MMKLTTYDKYKDSGVEWLGDVPKHWEVSRLKNIIDFISEKYIGEKFFRKIGLENIESESGKFLDIKNDFDGDGIFFQNNDILFGKLRPNLAKVYLSDFEGIAVGDFFVFRSKKVLFPKMLKYILLKSSTIEQTVSSTYGAKMPRVSWQFMSNMHFGFPPLPEQTQIANYLDQATTKIDKKIDLLTQKINHYQDLKTALINRAVTKGLDDSVEMKDSGVEWIGEIPKHWEVKRFKESVLKYTTGGTPTTSQSDFFYGKNIWVSIRDIGESKYINDSKTKLTDEALRSANIVKTPKGSLLYSFKLSIGKMAFASVDLYTNEAILSIFPNKHISLDFYYYMLPKFMDFASKENIYGAKMLNQKLIANAFIINPPKDEQQKIANYLDQKTSMIDDIIATITTQIEHQRELKKTLINDVVTGKVKVENS